VKAFCLLVRRECETRLPPASFDPSDFPIHFPTSAAFLPTVDDCDKE